MDFEEEEILEKGALEGHREHVRSESEAELAVEPTALLSPSATAESQSPTNGLSDLRANDFRLWVQR